MLGIAKLRARIEALEQTNAALAAQLETVSVRLAAEMERAAARTAEDSRLDDAVGALGERFGVLESRLVDQGAELRSLEAAASESTETARRQDRAIDQIRADIVRIDRQAGADVEALRQTSAAIAETLVRDRKT